MRKVGSRIKFNPDLEIELDLFVLTQALTILCQDAAQAALALRMLCLVPVLGGPLLIMVGG